MSQARRSRNIGSTSPSVSDRIGAWEQTTPGSNSDALGAVRLGGQQDTPALSSASQQVASNADNSSGGYDGTTGQWNSGNRPSKPNNLKGTDEVGTSLTAHHLYPWNKICSDLNSALAGKDRGEMQRLLDFGEVTVGNDFWQEFAQEPSARSPGFAQTLQGAVRDICWSPSNVFMGPITDKRGDDPGEELDTAYAKNGVLTPASAAAELMEKQGGIHADKSPLLERFMGNVREASGKMPRAYDPREWGEVTRDRNGKTKTKLERRGKVPVNASEDTEFDPTRTVSNTQQPQLTREERAAINRAEGMRIQAEQQAATLDAVVDDDDMGFAGWFGMDDDEEVVVDTAPEEDADMFGTLFG